MKIINFLIMLNNFFMSFNLGQLVIEAFNFHTIYVYNTIKYNLIQKISHESCVLELLSSTVKKRKRKQVEWIFLIVQVLFVNNRIQYKVIKLWQKYNFSSCLSWFSSDQTLFQASTDYARNTDHFIWILHLIRNETNYI